MLIPQQSRQDMEPFHATLAPTIWVVHIVTVPANQRKKFFTKLSCKLLLIKHKFQDAAPSIIISWEIFPDILSTTAETLHTISVFRVMHKENLQGGKFMNYEDISLNYSKKLSLILLKYHVVNVIIYFF